MKIMILLLLLSIVFFLYSIQKLLIYGGNNNKRRRTYKQNTGKRRKLSESESELDSEDEYYNFDSESENENNFDSESENENNFDSESENENNFDSESENENEYNFDSESENENNFDSESENENNFDSEFENEDNFDSESENGNENTFDSEDDDYLYDSYEDSDIDNEEDNSDLDWEILLDNIKMNNLVPDTHINMIPDESHEFKDDDYDMDYQEGINMESTTIIKGNFIDESFHTISQWSRKPIISTICNDTLLADESKTNIDQNYINFYFTDKIIECYEIDIFKTGFAFSYRDLKNNKNYSDFKNITFKTNELGTIYYKLKGANGDNYVEISNDLMKLLNKESKENNFYLKRSNIDHNPPLYNIIHRNEFIDIYIDKYIIENNFDKNTDIFIDGAKINSVKLHQMLENKFNIWEQKKRKQDKFEYNVTINFFVAIKFENKSYKLINFDQLKKEFERKNTLINLSKSKERGIFRQLHNNVVWHYNYQDFYYNIM